MWKRHRRWLISIALFGAALAVYFEPTHCVRGWLWGEAFFDGRPSSYWRKVVLRDADPPPPNWFQRKLDRWFGRTPRGSSLVLVLDAAASPVLAELARDDDQGVADFASYFRNRDSAMRSDFEKRVDWSFYFAKINFMKRPWPR